ncbi:MAG TPA: HIT domain-containing protein [Methylophaga aminisulfidivorans]|uniref:HIT domain-containing protein n=2 Tax=root TaxID=1 RepID=A0A7C1VR49_9GAMM|nr:HIT domain-containing protein [Methylophaga aminisulfidivorans]
MSYQLHQQLKKDTFKLGEFELCDVLLMNDARYPWVILVPKRDAISEIFQLSQTEQRQLQSESSFVAKAMKDLFSADKMNIAALGNMVEQLHLHHVARFRSDAAWPKPIWGQGQAENYSEVAVKAISSQLRRVLKQNLISDENLTF